MANERAEAIVGDVGTEYWVPTYDDDLELATFDATAATVKQLRFKMPGAPALLVRTATAVSKTIAGATVYGLRYIVTADDAAAYADPTTGGFHREAGSVALQGYVEFSSSQKWTGSMVTTDWRRRPLRVVAAMTV